MKLRDRVPPPPRLTIASHEGSNGYFRHPVPVRGQNGQSTPWWAHLYPASGSYARGMAGDFHKPTRYSGDKFDDFRGGEDPEQIMRLAHESAHALLDRAQKTDDPEVIERLVSYTDDNGVDALAELWARSSPRSLPGALWRIYLLRVLIRQDPQGTSLLFQRGSEVLRTIDTVVAGAEMPTGPDEIKDLADQILRGLFRGDFATALDRAAAFGRIMSAGCTSIADDTEPGHPERASELTARALAHSKTAEELAACARLSRAGTLD